jgi:hypothetical protein
VKRRHISDCICTDQRPLLPRRLLKKRRHVFMKYGIRFCGHLGRLLALCGLIPVKERQM